MTRDDMQKVLEIGISLSEEKDFNRLLEKILEQVMEITNCDAGTLYLKDGDFLKFKIMRNDTMKTYQGGDGKDPGLPPVPITRQSVCALALLEDHTICVEDVRNSENYDFSGPIRYDAMTGYHTQSILVVPMHNRRGTSVGVLQLINAMDKDGKVCAFGQDMVMVVESIASQAAITIQNMMYIEDIRGLFQSFVKVMSSAIDERTPYNASHTRHMEQYGSHFIKYLNQKSREENGKCLFTPAQEEELLMSVWLHDVGKLVTPLEVMNKAARLTEEQKKEIFHRYEVMELKNKLALLEEKQSAEEAERQAQEIAKARELVERINSAGFLPEEALQQLLVLGEAVFSDGNGNQMPFLTPEERKLLSIRKGTLSEEERKIMENHVVITEKLLSEIRFTSDYSHVREWASSHHEYLDGSGYPKQLKGQEVPMEVRINTILDIFDALIADDRPYKPGMPVDKALTILTIMAEKEGKLDPQLTKQFVESRCWE